MEIDIRHFMHAVRRWWWLPVVAGLLLGLVGFGIGKVAPPSYPATSQMLVTAQISGDGVLTDGARASTYLSLTTSGPVLDRVILELGLDLTRGELSNLVSTRLIPGTQIIEITVSSDDPQLSADIANAFSRNFIITATDLSVGEVQRNLDELQQQSSTLRDRVTVIDTRLAEIDTDANADDSQIQAEVSQLKRERLEVSQTIADIDSSTRSLTTTLSSMSIPIVVTDFATPSTQAGGSSASLMALLGLVLGGLVGIAGIVYLAFTDRYLRTDNQVVSQPVIATVKPGDNDSRFEVLAAAIAGIAKSSPDASVALLSAREGDDLSNFHASLAGEDMARFEIGNGVLDNAEATRIATSSDAALVIAGFDKTRISDLEELAKLLDLAGTRVIGTVLIAK